MTRDLWKLFDEQFAPIYLRAKSPLTLKQHRQTLKSLHKFLGRRPLLSDLNDATIAAWLTWLAATPYTGPGGRSRCKSHPPRIRSPRTINGRREFLLCFAGWLRRRGIIHVMPEAQPLPSPTLPVEAWSIAELRRLYAAAEKMPGTFGKWTPHPLRGIPHAAIWTAWIAVAWDTAERTGALLALRSAWLRENSLRVPGEVRKGGKAAHYILKPATLKRLEAIRFRERELIFPMYHQSQYRHFRHLLRLAGLPNTRKDLTHRIRRSFATHLAAHGGNATEALLHASTELTRRCYIDARMLNRPAPNLKLQNFTPSQVGKIQVWKERGGTAYFRLYYGDPITGKLVRKSAGTFDPQEAEQRREELEAELNKAIA